MRTGRAGEDGGTREQDDVYVPFEQVIFREPDDKG